MVGQDILLPDLELFLWLAFVALLAIADMVRPERG